MNNDLISREAVIERIKYEADICNSGITRGVLELLQTVVEGMPPAADAVEVVHGRWEYTGSVMQTCQRCETSYNLLGGNHCKPWNCCPNCGARMDGE